MIVYELSPIDAWIGWLTEEEFLAFGSEDAAWYAKDAKAEYETMKPKAEALAKRLGWEGDFRQGPYIAGLPNRNGNAWGTIMIGWKQDNNGTTFIASPYPLSWLDQDARNLKG